MIDVSTILKLHDQTVWRWHQEPVDNPYSGLLFVVCQQHGFNFLLWHEEDTARSPDASDTMMARVKRTIDKYNQQRNDWIEKIDDWITAYLAEERIAASHNAVQNSETVGSAMDRLSILALRIYHLREQCDRTDIDQEQLGRVTHKLTVCLEQRADLAKALAELIDDIRRGHKRHKTYRQLKMYNDPMLNPAIYQSRRRNAG
jgi:ADP-ribosylglycohydrolase